MLYSKSLDSFEYSSLIFSVSETHIGFPNRVNLSRYLAPPGHKFNHILMKIDFFFNFRLHLCDQHKILDWMMYLSQTVDEKFFSVSLGGHKEKIFSKKLKVVFRPIKNTSFSSEFDADSEYIIFMQKYWGRKNGLIRLPPLESSFKVVLFNTPKTQLLLFEVILLKVLCADFN